MGATRSYHNPGQTVTFITEPAPADKNEFGTNRKARRAAKAVLRRMQRRPKKPRVI